MAKVILCIAPHPDDETLGCAGALLKHRLNGDEIHWLIVTSMHVDDGYTLEQIECRNIEIKSVYEAYGFSSLTRLNYRPAGLDVVPLAELITDIGRCIKGLSADTIYIPYKYDAHTDHKIVFDASSACAKSFRYPSVKAVKVYETLSETSFGIELHGEGFSPNLFVNIEGQLDEKIAIMNLYKSEFKEFPFPRSEVCIKALASLRGSQVNAHACEAFMLVKLVE